MASIDWASAIAQYLKLGPDATAARGGLLAALGDSVQSQIEQRIGRPLSAAEATEVYDGDDKTVLILRRDPVLSVTSLYVNGAAVTVGALGATTYPPAAVIIRGQSLRYTNGSVFTAGYGNVIVTYTAGFNVPPPDLVQAGVIWAGMLFKDRDRLGLNSEGAGGQSTSFTREMPPFVVEACDKWTRWGLPC